MDNKFNRMMGGQKCVWEQSEDILIKQLYEEVGLRSWAQISKRLWERLSLSRKNAKQCKQRYENHICGDSSKGQWTIEEELMLIQYHNEIGNKWSVISQRLPGKSDNCIKNHFYSKLRKILRKLNAVIHAYFRREFREININVIYKIVEACEEQFKERPGCDSNVSTACRQIQNKMLHLSMLTNEVFDSQSRLGIYRDVVREIYDVSKMYKRKSKKSRNSAIQAPSIKIKHKKEVTIVQEGYISDNSSDLSSEEPVEDIRSASIKQPKAERQEVVVKDQQQGIKDLLKEAGLLIEQQHKQPQALNTNTNSFKISSRSSFKSYSENNNDSDQHFFQDSDFQKGFFSKKKGNYLRNLDDPSDRSDREGAPETLFN